MLKPWCKFITRVSGQNDVSTVRPWIPQQSPSFTHFDGEPSPGTHHFVMSQRALRPGQWGRITEDISRPMECTKTKNTFQPGASTDHILLEAANRGLILLFPFTFRGPWRSLCLRNTGWRDPNVYFECIWNIFYFEKEKHQNSRAVSARSLAHSLARSRPAGGRELVLSFISAWGYRLESKHC